MQDRRSRLDKLMLRLAQHAGFDFSAVRLKPVEGCANLPNLNLQGTSCRLFYK